MENYVNHVTAFVDTERYSSNYKLVRGQILLQPYVNFKI